ncbi:Uncharacterised protein [Chlamydia trachomatis]|nr:Uncharacterised protein [Chlamydia trachomatis]
MIGFIFGEMINVPASQFLRADMMNQDKIGSYSGFTQPIASIIASSMVSLSHFTGKIGVQISLLLLVSNRSVAYFKSSAHAPYSRLRREDVRLYQREIK